MPANRLAAAMGLVVCMSGTALACVTDPRAQRMTPQTDGSPEVFIIPGPVAVSQPTGLELVVCPHGAGQVSGLDVDAWMPDHQHGMNYDPDVEALGEGRYSVTNMVYHMPGLWQLKVSLRSGPQRAAYVLDMPIR